MGYLWNIHEKIYNKGIINTEETSEQSSNRIIP